MPNPGGDYIVKPWLGSVLCPTFSATPMTTLPLSMHLGDISAQPSTCNWRKAACLWQAPTVSPVGRRGRRNQGAISLKVIVCTNTTRRQLLSCCFLESSLTCTEDVDPSTS